MKNLCALALLVAATFVIGCAEKKPAPPAAPAAAPADKPADTTTTPPATPTPPAETK